MAVERLDLNTWVTAACLCRCQFVPRFVTLEEASDYLLWSKWAIYHTVREKGWPYVRLPIWGVEGGRPRYRVAMGLETYRKLYELRLSRAKPPIKLAPRLPKEKEL